MKAASYSQYSKEIEECRRAFNIEHRLYNEDSYFIKFFKFPDNHSQRIRNTDIKEIGRRFDKNISQKVISSLVSRHGGPELPLNRIRHHVFGNIDCFHRFFYETLLDSESFNELVRVTTALNFHQSDKDEENLIDQANALRERFYDYSASNYRMTHKSVKSKTDKAPANPMQIYLQEPPPPPPPIPQPIPIAAQYIPREYFPAMPMQPFNQLHPMHIPHPYPEYQQISAPDNHPEMEQNKFDQILFE
ncbi:hypothetical protein TRFO_13423 [Tritrichomonas foetus]|uniref:Uncharacterized protein n=1 Tax=Tritrichomonas foetus TaxID=1144522 RepID=A0A1J4KZ15_9EUKA|nr:hypothetical protein TRFO_13423 [Tritrichomonas foetus]|eukprot:OHT16104.1 hypothetical protein TRFO_13423 [Tritrichomonas foetus]